MKKPIIFLVVVMLALALIPMAAFGENIDHTPYHRFRETCTVEHYQHGENCPNAIDGQGRDNRCTDGNAYHRGYYNNGGVHCRSFKSNISSY